MALELNIGFGRSNDYFNIIVTDNTGVYNAVTNPGGYGTPNPAVGDFLTFDVSVTLPDPVTLLPSGTPITVSAYPTLPSSSSASYSITNVDLGFAADVALIDGVYLFDIVATTGAAEFTYQRYGVFSDIVGCCIKSLTLNAFGCDCNGKNKNLVKANMWLSLLKPTVNDGGDIIPSQVELCEQWNQAAEIIRELQKICNNQNCKGCGECK
jgi:hypothetical protein